MYLHHLNIFDLYLFYAFIALCVFLLFYLSKYKTLYVFSPIVLITFNLCVGDVIPLIYFYFEGSLLIPSNILYVTRLSVLINILFVLLTFKVYRAKVFIPLVPVTKKISSHRNTILFVSIGLMLFAGVISGVTKGVLTGGDVEDLRMTSDVGLGFIKKIPSLAIPIVLLYSMFYAKVKSWKPILIKTLLIGIFLFLATAARSSLQDMFYIFLIWFSIRYRSLKWYEYIVIFYFMRPLIAAFLSALRSQGVLESGISLIAYSFSQQFMVFAANSVKLMECISPQDLFHGESYYYQIVNIIPRFLWSEKPLAIDYKYKELVGYSFDGGGIYTTIPNDFYLNFGNIFFIGYILWMAMLYKMYTYLLKRNAKTSNCLLFLYLLGCTSSPLSIFGQIEIYLLFVIIVYFYNRRWRIM